MSKSVAEQYPHDTSREVIKVFETFCEIPRASGQEGAIAQKVKEMFPSHEIREDSFGNFAIDIPASEECEKAPRVMIQGHLDMVCKGGNDENPTHPYLDEDGWIKAQGDTTLGADNGIGVAMGIAAAKDNKLRHGPLTLLFTLYEEEGLKGAKELDPVLIPDDTEIGINLDSEDNEIFYGCAGASRITAELDISNKDQLPPDYQLWEIKLAGLSGGHSGLEIHTNPLNAIKLLSELLQKIFQDNNGVQLISFSGGTATNSVPKEAISVIAVPERDDLKSEDSQVLETIRRFHGQKRKEIPEYEGLRIDPKEIKNQAVWSIRGVQRDRLLNAISEIPSGPLEWLDDKESVSVSNNIAVLETLENIFRLLSMVRAMKPQDLDRTETEIIEILNQNKMQFYEPNKYYGWLADRSELAVGLAADAYEEINGQAAEPKVVHAGLECGVISGLLEKMGRKISMVSFGPIIKGAHEPEERVHAGTIDSNYRMLRRMLERITNLQ